MPQFRVDLFSIDSEDESRDIQFSTLVDATLNEDAVVKAKAVQRKERPAIHPADTWAWTAYKTAEKSAL